MKTLPPVVAIKIGPSRITALVGELQKDASILITGKVEYPPVPSEFGQSPDGADLKAALGAAEEQGQLCIYALHLVVACENVRYLIPEGAIPVLTSVKDTEIQKKIALIEGIDCVVNDVVFSGYCAALAVTTSEQRTEGVIVIDIGSEVATLAAFTEGRLVSLDACKTTGNVDANTIKYFSRAVEKAGVMDQNAASILLTGESAHAQGLSDEVKSAFGMPCAVGQPRGFSGLEAVVNNPTYATCLGIIRYAYTDGSSNISRSTSLFAAIRRYFGL